MESEMNQEEKQSTAPTMDSGNEAEDLHTPAPQVVEKPRQTLVLPVPLDRKYLAQLVIPADMSRAEMLRLRRLIWTLAVPWA